MGFCTLREDSEIDIGSLGRRDGDHGGVLHKEPGFGLHNGECVRVQHSMTSVSYRIARKTDNVPVENFIDVNQIVKSARPPTKFEFDRHECFIIRQA